MGAKCKRSWGAAKLRMMEMKARIELLASRALGLLKTSRRSYDWGDTAAADKMHDLMAARLGCFRRRICCGRWRWWWWWLRRRQRRRSCSGGSRRWYGSRSSAAATRTRASARVRVRIPRALALARKDDAAIYGEEHDVNAGSDAAADSSDGSAASSGATTNQHILHGVLPTN